MYVLKSINFSIGIQYSFELLKPREMASCKWLIVNMVGWPNILENSGVYIVYLLN